MAAKEQLKTDADAMSGNNLLSVRRITLAWISNEWCFACVGAGAGAGIVTTIVSGDEHFFTWFGVAVYSDQNGKQRLVTTYYDKHWPSSIDIQTGTARRIT